MDFPNEYGIKGLGFYPEPKRKYIYLTATEMTKLKPKLRRAHSEDSGFLFDAVWRDLLKYARNAEIIDYEHLNQLYEGIVSDKVNNPRSKFYMHG